MIYAEPKYEQDEIKRISDYVKSLCCLETNPWDKNLWHEHILYVVHIASYYADLLNANKVVVQLAAILHDIASISGWEYYREHHVHGKSMAKDILKETGGFSQRVIDEVAECIYRHRGSVELPRETLEQKIIASADAISHFANFCSLLHRSFVVLGLPYDEGIEDFKGKLKRSYGKIEITEAKEDIDIIYFSILAALLDTAFCNKIAKKMIPHNSKDNKGNNRHLMQITDISAINMVRRLSTFTGIAYYAIHHRGLSSSELRCYFRGVIDNIKDSGILDKDEAAGLRDAWLGPFEKADAFVSKILKSNTIDNYYGQALENFLALR